MKHLRHLLICIVSIMPVQALAHGDAEELGHHWQSHAYIGEIRFQLVLMAVLALAIFAVNTLIKKRANR